MGPGNKIREHQTGLGRKVAVASNTNTRAAKAQVCFASEDGHLKLALGT
jgi:hypothetical protein